MQTQVVNLAYEDTEQLLSARLAIKPSRSLIKAQTLPEDETWKWQLEQSRGGAWLFEPLGGRA